MMRHAVVTTTMLVLLGASPAFGQVPSGTTRYVPQNPRANSKNVQEGLESALKQVNPLLRPFVRAQLDPKRFDVQVLEFVRDDDGFIIRHDGHSTRSPSSGVHAALVRGEENVKLTQHLTAKGARQRFETKQGTLKLSYTLDPRAGTVDARARLTSGYLPSLVTYHLKFRKASP